jgi:hypothetical protein
MITFNLFPGGVMQLYEVLQNDIGTPADMNTWERRQPASWSGSGCQAISYLSLSVSRLCCG